MKHICLALGTNINKKKNLKECLEILKKRFRILKASGIYETLPVGYKNQPNFYNMVLEIETDYSPQDLFRQIISIEKKLGRVRKKKNYPRTIDIDILFYNKRIIRTKNLTIPHPRLYNRAFVLVPLNEIAPNFKHPKFKKSIKILLKELKNTEVIKKATL